MKRRLHRTTFLAFALLSVGAAAPASADGSATEPPASAETSAADVAKSTAARPSAVVAETVGRVLLRAANASGRAPARAGAELSAGSTLITGRDARAELRRGEGRWRVGALAVWTAEDAGARLFSGSALAVVPAGETAEVESLGGRVRLGAGVWMLTAVRNEGLKIICLEDSGELSAELAPAGDAAPAWKELRLRAGELVFLRPGGAGFGPVLTVFLQELLATSRLVNGFAEPLPQAGRLAVVAAAQRERIGALSNAVVGGARDAGGFDLVVPRWR